MSRGSFGIGAVLSIALLLLSAVPAAAGPARIDIHAKPGNAAAPIEITMSDAATSATVPVQIVLRAVLPARLAPRFALSPLTVREPSFARLPSKPAMSMVVGRRDITSGGFHPRTIGTFAAELRIRGIDTFGTFEGNVLAATGRSPMASRVQIIIRRYPAAELELAGFDGGTRTVTTTTSEADVSMDIHGTNLGTAEGVQLAVGPLRASDGSEATVEVVEDSVPDTLRGTTGGQRRLRVTMPRPGTYTGPVSYAWNASRRDATLTVDWTTPPLGVTVLGAQGATSEVPSCIRVAGQTVGSCATTAMWLVVQATDRREVTVDAPTLRSLVRIQDGLEVGAPAVGLAASLDCVAGPAEDDEGDEGTVQTCGRASYDATARRLTLQPGAVARMRLDLGGDVGPGEYVAQFAIGGPSETALVAEASVLVRIPAIGAFAALLIGCLLALPIRGSLTAGRRRLLRQVRLDALRERLAGQARRAADDEARRIVAVLGAAVERGLEETGSARRFDRGTDRRIEDFEFRIQMLDVWLGSWAASAGLAPAVQDRVRSRLMTLGQTLVQDARLSTAERRALVEIESVAEHLASTTAARTSATRDPRDRRPSEDGSTTAWSGRAGDVAGRLRRRLPLEAAILVTLITLTGLAVLWAPNATWGSLADIVTAVLWSVVGIAVATAAATGVLGLRAPQ
jgi:hypothetical protein